MLTPAGPTEWGNSSEAESGRSRTSHPVWMCTRIYRLRQSRPCADGVRRPCTVPLRNGPPYGAGGAKGSGPDAAVAQGRLEQFEGLAGGCGERLADLVAGLAGQDAPGGFGE